MKRPFSKIWVRSREAKWLRKHPGVSNNQEVFPPLGMKEQEDRAVSRTKLLVRDCGLPCSKAAMGNQSSTEQEPGQ